MLQSPSLRAVAIVAAGLFCSVYSPPADGAAPRRDPTELTALFQPFDTVQMTLSPDGQHLAYTERKGEALYLVFRDLRVNKVTRIFVAEDKAEEMSGAKEKTPASISFMRWAADDRLVFKFLQNNIWSVRPDGSDARRLVDPGQFQGHVAAVGGIDAGVSEGTLDPEALLSGRGFPRSTLEAVKERTDPINIVGMPRGHNSLFVEAILHHRGATAEKGRINDGLVRAVQRVDLTTGKMSEIGEVIARADAVIADHQGRPRLASYREDPHSHTVQLVMSNKGKHPWKPIEQLIAPELGQTFVQKPASRFRESSYPLGFDFSGEVLYYASNVGRDTFGIFAVDTKTGQKTDVAIETPAADLFDPSSGEKSNLLFDDWKRQLVGVRYVGVERATLWLDSDFTAVQRTLNGVDPGKRWEILEWSEARTHFLVMASSSTEPGVFYVFNRSTNQLDEVTSRAPWLPESGRNTGSSFGFRTRSGVMITGYITVPLRPLLKRSPLVVLCHDGPWNRDQPGYNREAQALAWMGFTVLQVNYRGSSGFGLQHLNALRESHDTAAIDDILTAMDRLNRDIFDRRLVAIMGKGYGGLLALRALQLHPTRFRCAVTIDAPTDLGAWIGSTDVIREIGVPSSEMTDGAVFGARRGGTSTTTEVRRAYFGDDSARWKAVSPLTHANLTKGPVMLIEGPEFHGGRGDTFAGIVRKNGVQAEYAALNGDEAADLPKAKAALYSRIYGFLNESIYNFWVKEGELKEVESATRPQAPNAPEK